MLKGMEKVVWSLEIGGQRVEVGFKEFQNRHQKTDVRFG